MKFSRNRKNTILASVAAIVLIGGGVASSLGHRHSEDAGSAGAKAAAQEKALYSCPMHPAITSHEPGQCPICHMDLSKVDDEEEGQKAEPNGNVQGIEGRAGFSLSLEKQQLIGVASVHTEKRHLSFEVRATGRVAFDPDLYTAIEEYRQALLTQTQAQGNSFEQVRQQAKELVDASHTRLRLLGLSQQQIRDIGKRGTGNMELLLPNGSVWVYAEIYEYEIGGIRPGQSISVQAPAVPGKVFTGKISSISPVVNSPTRTVRVRALVPDPNGLLRPDTFVNVSVRVDYGTKLAVPEDAVMHSGNGAFVFVVKGKGRFEPRPVATGVKANHYYEVVSGLEDREAVVSAANFLIDSESRLRSALKNMQSPAEAPKPSDAPAGHAGHGSH